jgi:hypothetical protein
MLPRRSASATQNSVVSSENSWNSPPQKTPCYCPSRLTTTPSSLEALAQPRVCVLPAHGWTALQCGACVCMRWHACVGQTARAQAVSVPRRGREPHASGAVRCARPRTALQCGACVCMRWHACVGQTARAQTVSVPRRGREPHASGAVRCARPRDTARQRGLCV